MAKVVIGKEYRPARFECRDVAQTYRAFNPRMDKTALDTQTMLLKPPVASMTPALCWRSALYSLGAVAFCVAAFILYQATR